MDKFKLAIGIHNHQPVGNFDSIFDEAHNKAYKPFLELFDQFENLRMSLHQSGILWLWQQERYPPYFDLVQKLVYDNRIDIMTGGFYEPILPSIPDRDKLGQIEMLSRYLEGQFGVDALGLWVTERVWEPHLPKVLNQAGVQYVPIDDTHFLYAGFELNQLRGVFLTEEEGYSVKLLPIQKRLRYLIPFGSVEEVIDELRAQADINPGGLAVYADDGEKFGVWPKTHQHCYVDGWLKDFFRALTDNSDWLEVISLREAAQTKPVGRAYLPTASYAEMLHWALPPMAFNEYEEFEEWLKKRGKFEQYNRFVRGGHWRGFLAKYDESNYMHKRMLLVSEKFKKRLEEKPRDYETNDKIRHHLYAAQCNCAYWHGVFGGLYLPHLRSAVYEHIIRAEELLKTARENVKTELKDYDGDGYDEVIVSTNKMVSIIKPSLGGMMVELDNYESAFNVTDTLRRRKEGYHWKLAGAKLEHENKTAGEKTESIHDLVLTKEKGLDKILADDWHARRCFIDHFLTSNTDIEKYASGNYGDDGDFVLEPWLYDGSRQMSNPGKVKLRREGNLWRPDGVKPLTIDKIFYFDNDSDVVGVNYMLTAGEDVPLVRFAVENNFNLLAGHADDRYVMFNGEKPRNSYLDALNSVKKCTSVVLQDEWLKMSIGFLIDREAEVWQTPIFTVSLSEGGFEKVYQGTTILSIFNLSLKKDKPVEISFMLYTGKPENMPPRMLRKPVDAMVQE